MDTSRAIAPAVAAAGEVCASPVRSPEEQIEQERADADRRFREQSENDKLRKRVAGLEQQVADRDGQIKTLEESPCLELSDALADLRTTIGRARPAEREGLQKVPYDMGEETELEVPIGGAMLERGMRFGVTLIGFLWRVEAR